MLCVSNIVRTYSQVHSCKGIPFFGEVDAIAQSGHAGEFFVDYGEARTLLVVVS